LGSIANVLPIFEVLRSLLDKERNVKGKKSDTLVRKASQAGWEKLDKYSVLTDKSPIYVVATILDPRLKLEYFQKVCNWSTERVREVREVVEDFYHEHYRTWGGGNHHALLQAQNNGAFPTFGFAHLNPPVETSRARDELEVYLEWSRIGANRCPWKW
jgi:hypothetical protein